MGGTVPETMSMSQYLSDSTGLQAAIPFWFREMYSWLPERLLEYYYWLYSQNVDYATYLYETAASAYKEAASAASKTLGEATEYVTSGKITSDIGKSVSKVAESKVQETYQVGSAFAKLFGLDDELAAIKSTAGEAAEDVAEAIGKAAESKTEEVYEWGSAAAQLLGTTTSGIGKAVGEGIETAGEAIGGAAEYITSGKIVSDFIENAGNRMQEFSQELSNPAEAITGAILGLNPTIGIINREISAFDSLFGTGQDVTISQAQINQEEQKLTDIYNDINSREQSISDLESQITTLYDSNMKNGEWVGSEADYNKFMELYDQYESAYNKYTSLIDQYNTQQQTITNLREQRTEEVESSYLTVGWYNLWNKTITPGISDWWKSGILSNVISPISSGVSAYRDFTSGVEKSTEGTIFKPLGSAIGWTGGAASTAWINPTNISAHDFIWYGVAQAPEFLGTMAGGLPSGIEYAIREPGDFASVYPSKLAEETQGTVTFATEHPGAFFGMLALPTVTKGIKGIPRQLSKFSPGYDRTPVWSGRSTFTDVVRGKTPTKTWWKQYREAQPSFREAMRNTAVDPLVVKDIITGKTSVRGAVSDILKVKPGEGPGIGEYIRPNRWKTKDYTPTTTAEKLLGYGGKEIEASHSTGNVWAESVAKEGTFTVENLSRSIYEKPMYFGKDVLAPLLEHDYPAIVRIRSTVGKYSEKVTKLVNKAAEYDRLIEELEKKLKKSGLSKKENAKLQKLKNELENLEKELEEQVLKEYKESPKNVLLPGPKPISRKGFHGKLQEEFAVKPGSTFYRAENWRTRLYGRFGLTKGTKFKYDPKSKEKVEVYEYSFERPKSFGQKPEVIFDVPKFRRDIFYNPTYQAISFGARKIRRIVESPARKLKESQAEKELLAKIKNPEDLKTAKAVIEIMRDIRGMKSAIKLDIDLAALKEVGPELAGPLSELIQKYRVVMYGSGVTSGAIPKQRLWRQLKDADLFIPREEVASFLFDAKKMFEKLGMDVKQKGITIVSKEGRHLLDIHQAPEGYPLIGTRGVTRRDPYSKQKETTPAVDYMPDRLEMGEKFVRETLSTQAQRKLTSMLDQLSTGKFKQHRAKDFSDGILSVEELLDVAEGKYDPHFFEIGYERATNYFEKTKWNQLAEIYQSLKESTIDKVTKAKIEKIRKKLDILKEHSYIKPLYEKALKEGAVYRLDNFEELLREVSEAESKIGMARERGGYLDLTTGLSRLSKIGGERAVEYMPSEAGITSAERGSILDYHTHPFTGDIFDIFSFQDIKVFLYNDIKQGAVVTGGKTYVFTKGPKTDAILDSIIKSNYDQFTGRNIGHLSEPAKISNYIDGLVEELQKKNDLQLYRKVSKDKPGLTRREYLSNADYQSLLYNMVVKDLAKKLGCKVEESTFGKTTARKDILWVDRESIADRFESSKAKFSRDLSVDLSVLEPEKPRALLNVGYSYTSPRLTKPRLRWPPSFREPYLAGKTPPQTKQGRVPTIYKEPGYTYGPPSKTPPSKTPPSKTPPSTTPSTPPLPSKPPKIYQYYHYPYPKYGYGYGPYDYTYEYPPTKTTIPPMLITTDGTIRYRKKKKTSQQLTSRKLMKYHKFSETSIGATPSQVLNLIWGNAAAMEQMRKAHEQTSNVMTSPKSTKKTKKQSPKAKKKDLSFDQRRNILMTTHL